MSQRVGLDERRKVFGLFGILGLVVVGLMHPVAALFEQRADPDVLTAVLLGALAVEIPALSLFLFTPSQGSKMRARLAEQGQTNEPAVVRAASLLAAALALSPIVVGIVLLILSGDLWRLYAFTLLSLAGAAIYWNRLGTVFEGTLPPTAPKPGG
ncbi:MAG: hypothetical protein ACRDKT_13970 [Actinomycetota bacterium]